MRYVVRTRAVGILLLVVIAMCVKFIRIQHFVFDKRILTIYYCIYFEF